MFEKEGYPQDLSSINITAYTGQKSQKRCQLPCNSIVLFILLGFLFIFIGIIELVSNYQTNYIQIPMQKAGNVLWSPQEAYFSFKEEDNVGVYIHIDNLTQFSSNDDQTDYHITQQTQIMPGYCHNYRTNQQIGKTIAIDGNTLNPLSEAIPCGFYEGMFPSGVVNITLGSGPPITIISDNLAYFEYDFYNANISQQWVDLESESFKSWIEPNVAIGTTKLIGHLPANFTGLVKVNITMNNGFPKELGEVTIIFASTKAFANRNVSFCIANFFQSACLFLFASIIFFYNKLIDREVQANSMKAQTTQYKTQVDSQELKSNHKE